MERTNVDSNHIRFCQKNRATKLDEEGRRVNEWSGLGGGRLAGIAFIAMISELASEDCDVDFWLYFQMFPRSQIVTCNK